VAKGVLKRLILSVLLFFARLTDRWRRGRIPVLIYHAIDESGSPISTSRERFWDHWTYLRRRGFHPIALCQAAGLIRSGCLFPPRSVVITFDDGYRNNVEPIRAIMQAGGRPTLFLPVERLGGDNAWDAVRSDIPKMPLLTPAEVMDLARGGCEIGGHSLSHANLSSLSPGDLRCEVEGCRKRLEALTGQPILSFAYPYGAYNTQVVNAVQEAGFLAACTTVPDYLNARNSLLEIPRFSAGNTVDFLTYRLVLHRGLHWYIGLQRLIFHHERTAG